MSLEFRIAIMEHIDQLWAELNPGKPKPVLFKMSNQDLVNLEDSLVILKNTN